jgi:hypothetical protein
MASTLKLTDIQHPSSDVAAITVGSDNSVSIVGGALSPQTGFKNRIINGAMTIDQRNAGASVTPAANGFTLDRWNAIMSAASKYSVQQSATAPAGFKNSLIVTSTSAYSVGASEAFNLLQSIEGLNISDLGWGTADAQAVTLSFWVRSSLTGTFGGVLQNENNTRSYPFSYTISTANTYEYKTIAIVGDTTGTWLTTNGLGIKVRFSLGAGATVSGTAGAWSGSDFRSATGATSVVGTSGATFYLSGVQLEKGSTATPFEFRSIGQELALCQRYFESGYQFGVTPGTPQGSGNRPSINLLAAFGAYLGTGISFKTIKRSAATVTIYDNSGNAGKLNTNAGANQTVTVDYFGDRGFRVYSSVSGTVIIEGFWVASSEL